MKKIVSILIVLGLLITGCSALGGRSAQSAATPTTVPTTAAGTTPTETPVPPTTTLPTPIPSGAGITEVAGQSSFTRADVDSVLGADNWFCFPDRLDGIGVRNWPLGRTITWPLSSVDKSGIKYGPNEVPPGTGGATAWLQGVLACRNECPPDTRGIVKTLADIRSLPYVSKVELVNSTNGQAHVWVSEPFTVPTGWTVSYMGPNYSEGQNVPAKSGEKSTWWAPGWAKPLK